MAISFQNSTGGTIGTAASTWSLAVQTGQVVGGAFIVGIGCNTGVTVNAVTDNTTNVYTSCVRANGPSTSSAELWATYGIGSTLSTRVSITLSGNSSGSIAIGHWTGLSTNNPFLGVKGSSAISANSTSHGASEVVLSSNGLAVSFCRMTASTIGTISTLGAMTTWISTNVAARTFGMYRINGASASTATGSFTTSSGCQHAAVIAVFSDTSAVIPGGHRVQRMMMGFGF